jgi:hypothetical protein
LHGVDHFVGQRAQVIDRQAGAQVGQGHPLFAYGLKIEHEKSFLH